MQDLRISDPWHGMACRCGCTVVAVRYSLVV
jgi:hypothetical protein